MREPFNLKLENNTDSVSNNVPEVLQFSGVIKDQQDLQFKLLIVDDNKDIHKVTSTILEDYTFQGKDLLIMHAYSGMQAKTIIKNNPDTAMILLDVVMETEQAGLDVIKYIRESLDNKLVRIVLRTGHSISAPEEEIITQYDINDYKEKSELTSKKLKTTITTSLRSYADLQKMQSLVISNDILEQRVQERTQELSDINLQLQNEISYRNSINDTLMKNKVSLLEAQAITNTGNWEWELITGDMYWSDQVYNILKLDKATTNASIDELLNVIVPAYKEEILNAYKSCQAFSIEHQIICHDGDVRVVHQHTKIINDSEGEPLRMVGIIQDITDQHETEQTRKKLSAAVEQTADSIMITDNNGSIEYVNPAFENMTGFKKSEITGKTPCILKSGKQDPDFYKRLWNTILSGEVYRNVLVNKKKNGELYYEEKTISPQKDQQGNITHFISTGKDISERIKAQNQLEYLAHHDALTGLPNRLLFQDRLDQALARSRWRNRNIAVMFLDLDRFKVINDTLGHDIGDYLLREFSNRLSDSLRDGDTIARLGGDEFAIILNDIASNDDIEPIANKILGSLETSFKISTHELYVTTSIGISLFPVNGIDSKTLIKKADVAMYRAKESGRNNYQFYTEEDDIKAVERLSMENGLRRALENEEFFLIYQPQLDLHSGKITGMEALLRWKHSEFSTVSPAHFIPLLEETGMIVPVGEWALRKACMHTRAMHLMGMPKYTVSVNLSIRQFLNNDLVESVTRILDETGLEAKYLEFEVTEGILIEQIEKTSKILEYLHNMGITLSIDDFGTGYSSLNYLKKLPFDKLKIDRAFVSDISDCGDDAAISTAIITMAQSMNLQVIAEGVETANQLRFLHDHGCDAIQGYLCSPPLPLESFEKLVNVDQSGFLSSMLNGQRPQC